MGLGSDLWGRTPSHPSLRGPIGAVMGLGGGVQWGRAPLFLPLYVNLQGQLWGGRGRMLWGRTPPSLLMWP